ncbi:MAG: DUF3108 domain-containing protein [Bacteroidia bacterium]|nr:DUF3108 domain-containing protein [Bacteroidia bacterium]
MKTLLSVIVLITGWFAKQADHTEKITLPAFKSGETLKYSLHYGFFDGGIAYLNIDEKTVDGRRMFHAKAFARTSGITDKIYKVRDMYECYMDPETCLPIKSIRNVKEGNYRQYNEVVYNLDEQKAISQRSGEHKVPMDIQDIVSSFYYARNSLFANLKAGQVIAMNTFFDDRIYPLKIRFRGDETIESRFGKINCLRFSPEVEPGRVFDTKDDLDVWISNDENYIPIRIQLNLFVGSVKCDLVEYAGLQKNLKKSED